MVAPPARRPEPLPPDGRCPHCGHVMRSDNDRPSLVEPSWSWQPFDEATRRRHAITDVSIIVAGVVLAVVATLGFSMGWLT